MHSLRSQARNSPVVRCSAREECFVDDLSGELIGEVNRLVNEDPGPSQVDRPRSQGVHHRRQPVLNDDGELELELGRSAGEMQGGPQLGNRGIHREFHVRFHPPGVDLVGDRRHRLEHHGLVIGHHPAVTPQGFDPVWT
jgi:hypothetical protein